jgi:hypothetical protein
MLSRWRQFLALPLALAFAAGGAGLAVAQESEPAPVEMAGETFEGAPGITETVAEIMAREARVPYGALAPRQQRKHTFKLLKRDNPFAPAVSSWPPSEAIDESEGVPDLLRPIGPRNPQTVGTNFLGIQGCCGPGAQSNFVPPDSIGDVGPTQVMVVANGRIKVFSKAGVLGGLDASTDTFFASVRVGSVSDPHVRYDRLSQRWFINIIDVGGCPNNVLLAVSSGPTITSAASFTFFSFVGQADFFTDYPTLGVDANALYIGGNMFDVTQVGCPPPSAVNTTVWVVNKANLIAGTLTVTAFRNLAASGVGPWTPQGADNDEPGATEGYFVGTDFFVFSRMPVYRVNTPGGTPTLTGPFNITVPTTVFPIDQPQPVGPVLDALDDRPFAADVFRNKITGVTTLWTAHNFEVNSSGVGVGGGGRNGSRWYEFGNLTTTPSLVQSGTLFDPAATTPFGYWIPSVAMSGQGHMAIGVSRASASAANGGHASIAVAGRLRTDASGTTQAPTLAQGSTFNYDTFAPAPERWGDYSQTVVDPNDNQTMWTFQEYAAVQANTWGVRVTQLRAPGPATPSSASPSTISAGQASVSVTITGTSTAGTEFFDPGPDTGGPGFANRIAASVSGGVTVNSVTFASPTSVTLSLNTTAATAGTKNVTITNPDGQQATGNNLITVTGVCPTITVNPATVPNGVTGSPYSVTFTQTGGVIPVTFTFHGTIPPGLGFAAPTLAGTPSQAGIFSFAVRATDVNGCAGSRLYSLSIGTAGIMSPFALNADPLGNLVLEPTESVAISPSWFNGTAAPVLLTGTASNFTGPVGPTYTLTDFAASYGTIGTAASANCISQGNCYLVSVTGTRPGTHWDSTFLETPTTGSPKTWTLHVGGSFTDVPTTNPFYRFIETLLHKNVTGGCAAGLYCPANATTRQEMAAFVLLAKEPPGFFPPDCAVPPFNDVPAGSPFCRWIRELSTRGVVAGCGSGNYCPGNSVLRQEMAIFALATLSPTFTPPPCTTPPFADVAIGNPFCPAIQELRNRGVVSGCTPTNYCPGSPVTRQEMAVFMTGTFGLRLYLP